MPGDYQAFAATSVIIGELLCEAVDVRAGWRVLDVATGTGNAALAASRRFCTVVGVDLVPDGLGTGRRRAAAEGVDVTFVAGDASRLPFPDESFDAVVSTLGTMFAFDQQAAADELVRVCRPGGRIGLVNWVPDGWAAAFFSMLVELTGAPPNGDSESLFRWGTETGLEELFGENVASLLTTRRTFRARHLSPESYWRFVQHTSDFVQDRLACVDAGTRRRIDAEVMALVRRFNRSDDATVLTVHDYLEAVAVKAEERPLSSTGSRCR